MTRQSETGSFNSSPCPWCCLCMGQNHYPIDLGSCLYPRKRSMVSERNMFEMKCGEPHTLRCVKAGVGCWVWGGIGSILGGISAMFSSHKFIFISVWYKWRLIKQSNVNHYLCPCGKIEYLLVCLPCGRSLRWLGPNQGRFFRVLFIVYFARASRRTCWTTFLVDVGSRAMILSGANPDFCDWGEILLSASDSWEGQPTLN